MKRKSTVLILLLAVLIALVFRFLPTIIRRAAVAYISFASPANMILVGDSVLCEELKSRIEKQSVEDKEKTYHSLLSLLKLPAAEYAERVNHENFLRQVLNAIESDIDIPSAGGIHQSQSCLLGTLGLYRHHLDQTLPLLLKSDLVASAPNSQMRLQLSTFVQTECAGQTICVKPLKDEIMRNHSFMANRQYIALLRTLGTPSFTAAFEIIDSLSDDDLKKTDSDATYMSQALLTSFAIDSVQRDVVQIEFEKRLKDPKYSSVKKDLLTRSLPGFAPSLLPLASSQQVHLKELIEKGDLILTSYLKQMPQSTSELEEWLRGVSNLYSVKISTEEAASLLRIVNGMVTWAVKAIGPEANLMQSLLQVAASKDKITAVLPITYELLKVQKTLALGLRFLMSHDPVSISDQNLYLTKFKDLPESDRAMNLSLYSQYPTRFAGDFAYRMAEQITESEFQNYVSVFAQRRDDILLSWKRVSPTFKDPKIISSWNWKIFLLTGNAEVGQRMKKEWLKVPNCSELRMSQIRSFLMSAGGLEKNRDLVSVVIVCAKQDIDQVVGVLSTLGLHNQKTKKEVLQLIAASGLSKADKARLIKQLEQRPDPYGPMNPVPADGAEGDGV